MSQMAIQNVTIDAKYHNLTLYVTTLYVTKISFFFSKCHKILISLHSLTAIREIECFSLIRLFGRVSVLGHAVNEMNHYYYTFYADQKYFCSQKKLVDFQSRYAKLKLSV